MRTADKIAIAVAVIGLTGTITAALINSGTFRQKSENPPVADQRQAGGADAGNSVAAGEDRTKFAPHAPEIQVGAQTQVWGEQTRLLSLEPGGKAELRAQDLYLQATTYPGLSCAGPGYVLYTWQVRHPYPEGGDLEIRGTIPRSGGNTDQVALGAMGRVTMGGCDEHFFINRGMQPLKIEVRYASAIDDEASAAYWRQEEEAAEVEAAAKGAAGQ